MASVKVRANPRKRIRRLSRPLGSPGGSRWGNILNPHFRLRSEFRLPSGLERDAPAEHALPCPILTPVPKEEATAG